MKTFFKQLFCKHMYKFIKRDFLRLTREGSDVYWITYYSNYVYYAETHECISCEKKKVFEKKYLSK